MPIYDGGMLDLPESESEALGEWEYLSNILAPIGSRGDRPTSITKMVGPGPLTVALLAEPTLAPMPGVFLAKGVFGPAGILAHGVPASAVVLRECDRLQVPRVETSAVPTEVVKVEAVGNGTTELLIGEPVRGDHAPLVVRDAVAVQPDSSAPYPARGLIMDVLGQSGGEGSATLHADKSNPFDHRWIDAA
jgi:hypothetical protein